MIDSLTTKNNTLKNAEKLLKYALGITAVLYLITYFIIVLSRIQYPFELEWMEGGAVDHVRRILSGEKLYVTPSLDFIPYLYTPFYFYLSAIIAKITGIGFLPLRLVSFLASLGCFYIIFILVKRETHSKFYGILASGLFAATFRISGAWLDIARVDSLFIFLFLTAIYLIRFGNSIKTYIIAGILVFLSFFTKQTALFMIFPILIYSFINNWRYTLILAGCALLLIVGSTFYLNSVTGGWYNYYIFKLPAQHSIDKSMLGVFWIYDIITKIPFAFLLSLLLIPLYFVKSDKNQYDETFPSEELRLANDKTKSRKLFFYFLVLISMIAGSLYSRLHPGGWNNVLIPAYAGIAITTAIALSEIYKYVKNMPVNKQKLIIIAYVICIIQFIMLVYNPVEQIPTRKDTECGKKLISTIKEIPGEVIIPYHGYLTHMAGKNTHAQAMALFDIVLKGDDGPIKENIGAQIIQALENKKFSAIIIDEGGWWFQQVIEKYYVKYRVVFDATDSSWPVTGLKTRPQYIYVPGKEK